jgi:hypothetical protein|tara:strand:+ start:122 stop:295 length:174 start_codon:yes stop_codon:yes gene_type:complete
VEVEEEQIQEIHLGLMVEVVVLADHMLVVVMEVVLVLLMLENQHLVEVLAEQLMVVE